jgi:hypothetical protein
VPELWKIRLEKLSDCMLVLFWLQGRLPKNTHDWVGAGKNNPYGWCLVEGVLQDLQGVEKHLKISWQHTRKGGRKAPFSRY